MKENRFSMVPSKLNQPGNNKNNLNLTNQQINNDSKNNRRSTSQSILPRATTFSSFGNIKTNDSRPIKDPLFQEQSIAKILDFLIKQCYDRPIARKELISPQAKDFTNLFTFILSKIRPDWNITINKLDEDVIPILNDLRYPGYLTKSHLVAVGAPNTWPHLLAVLYWMVELAGYINFDYLAEFEETEDENNKRNSTNITNSEEIKKIQDNILEQNLQEFLNEGFKQNLIKGDSFQAVENFHMKTEELIKLNFSNSDKLSVDFLNLDKLSDELSKNHPTLIETKLKLEIISRELNHSQNNLNHYEKQFNELQTQIENKNKLYESKCDKNKEYMKTIEDVDHVIKNQKFSYEEFEKMKHNKNLIEKQLQVLMIKRQELNDQIGVVNNNVEQKTINLNEKIRNTNIISQKLNLEKSNLVDINLENISNNFSDLNVNEYNQQFLKCNNFLLNEINCRNIEFKEKQEFLITLKSDLLKMEDKLHEVNDIFNQKQMEHQRDNGLLQNEKDKYLQIIFQKNEEIKNHNDNLQRIINLIQEKEKELEDLKILENNLNLKFLDEEDKAEKFIHEMDEEYQSTVVEVEKIKKENVVLLRRNHKNILKFFDSLKNDA